MFRTSRLFRAVAISQAGTLLPDAADIVKHVDVGENAWARLAYINKRDNEPDRWLRLKIVPGGCRGFTYEFHLANTKDKKAEAERFPDDIEFVNDSCVPKADDELPVSDGADKSNSSSSSTTSAAEKKTTARFLIDGVSLSKLKEAKIEFVSNLSGMGFYVDGNKNVDKSCACKLSFSMRDDEE